MNQLVATEGLTSYISLHVPRFPWMSLDVLDVLARARYYAVCLHGGLEEQAVRARCDASAWRACAGDWKEERVYSFAKTINRELMS